MNARMKKLGVTQSGYNRGIVQGEFLANHEAFLAKAATLKKGHYRGLTVTKMWFGSGAGEAKHQQLKPYWRGLSAKLPKYFIYSDTHDLDSLIVR